MSPRAIVYPYKLKRWHEQHSAEAPELDCPYCRAAGWFAPEQATRQSARAEAAEALRAEAERHRHIPGSTDSFRYGISYAARFLESLASDNEGKADGNGG